MTYKNALAELPLGGGKAVIIGDNAIKGRERLFRAHGRFIDSLRGQFITGEDVGTSPADMEYVQPGDNLRRRAAWELRRSFPANSSRRFSSHPRCRQTSLGQ
jgi:glutamate dehydrogenase/leucine dehydrogenase